MADITQNFSQLLLTYGPGAMLDLPEHAVVVGWSSGLALCRFELATGRRGTPRRAPASATRREAESELRRAASPPDVRRGAPRRQRARRGGSAFPDLVSRRRTSRHRTTRTPDSAPPARVEKRRRIVEFGDLTVTNAGKLSYKGDAKKADVNPIRFVGACAKGHLQDIDWRFLAHRNGDRSCRKPLFWVERGVSSDPSDISVRCTCGASVTLADLYKPKFLGGCACHSPWLTPRRIADEACSDDLRLLPRSATNTYFPQTVTVISLTKADDRVRQAIAEHKTTIDGIRALPNFLDVLRAIPQTKEAFKDFSDDEIKQALTKELVSSLPRRTSIRASPNSTCSPAERPSSGPTTQAPSFTPRLCRATAFDFRSPGPHF